MRVLIVVKWVEIVNYLRLLVKVVLLLKFRNNWYVVFIVLNCILMGVFKYYWNIERVKNEFNLVLFILVLKC